MGAPVRYTVTSHCLARGTLTLTPALARALEGTPPVVRLGKESYPLEVDQERGLVLGLKEVYEASRYFEALAAHPALSREKEVPWKEKLPVR